MNIMTVQTGGPITGIRSVARAARNIAKYGNIFTRVEEGCRDVEEFFGGGEGSSLKGARMAASAK
jgi:hypothetical protein